MKLLKALLIYIYLFIFFVPLAFAEDLKISSLIRPPFTMQWENWELTGFSVELWDAVAEKINREYTIESYEVFSELLADTQSGKNHLSIGNISITSGREEVMDFSNPIFDSWLALMVGGESAQQESFLHHILSWYSLLWIIILTLWPLIVSLNVLSYSYTNFVIHDTLSKSYNIGTLADKNVACIASSTAEKFLIELDIPYKAYDSLDEIYSSLTLWESEVLVHDYPVLLYKSQKEPSFTLVWDIFKKEKYWILYPKWSDLKEPVNIALLELQGEGVYDTIYSKYFWDE